MLSPQFKPDRRIALTNFPTLCAVIVALLVLLFCATPQPFHHGVAISLPRASNAIVMRGADREDALIIAIARDGQIFFDRKIVTFDEVPLLLRDRLRAHALPTVYIKADARVRYHTVSSVLDSIRDAGLANVALLVN
jgi:biopolymer transport protein ExbD